MTFYAYILKNPLKNNEPFYVGKGRGERFSFHIKSATNNWAESKRNKHKSNTIKQIVENKLQVTVELFYFEKEQDALNKEIELIKKYGLSIEGGILTNLTYGGDGYKRPGIKVDQYDMHENFIRTFNSIQDASLFLTGNNNCKSSIKECLDGLRRSCHKFKWAYHGEPIKITVHNKIKPIAQLYTNGQLVASYTSINEAATKNKFDGSSITGVCKGKYKKAYGYIWKYQ